MKGDLIMNKKMVSLLFCVVVLLLISGCAEEKASISETDPAQPSPQEIQEIQQPAPAVSEEKPTISIQEDQAIVPESPEIPPQKTQFSDDTLNLNDKASLPVLHNLGINIEKYDSATKMAGDFEFKNKNYVDNKIFTEFAHKIVNDMGEKLLPEIGFNAPVGTKVVSPIDGVITDVKFYEPSQDYLVSMKTDESSPWIVGFEHVHNMRMKVGDKVLVGQELAEVSPSYGRTEFGNIEINVWTGGQNIIKHCPFEFLEESLKPIYEEKINQLAKDWEEFIGKDVYKQEDWVAPGCLLHNITER